MNTPTRFRNAIVSLPGATYASRVFAKEAPDDLAGAVWLVIDRIATRREAAHDGDGRLSEVLFQVTVGGGVRSEVESVKDFLIEGLHGLDYPDPTGSIAILLDNETDDLDAEHRVFTSQLDFTVLDNN